MDNGYATDILSKPPPEGVTVKQGMTGNGVTLIVRQRMPFVIRLLFIFFLVLSLLLMTGLIYVGGADIQLILKGSPFPVATLYLFFFYGKTTIRLNNGQGTVWEGNGILQRVKFTYGQSSSIRPTAAFFKNNTRSVSRLLVRTNNRDFYFGTDFPDEVQEYILAFLIRESRR